MLSKRNFRVIVTLCVLAIALFLQATPSVAQSAGLYLSGTTGFNSGIQPPKGFTYANLFTYYDAERLKGPFGGPIPVNGSFAMKVDQNIFFYVSKWKLLGGNFGMFYDVVIANGAITSGGDLLSPNNPITLGGSGLGDFYFAPFTLGWHKKRADFQVIMGFVAPTGRYNMNPPQSFSNIGGGYWGYLPQFAATFYLTKNHGTAFSFNNVYEFHGSTQKAPSLVSPGGSETPGQTYTLEYGLSQILPLDKKNMSKLLQVGIVGYDQFQVTNNTGPGAPLLFKNQHYRANAIGTELDFIMPAKHLDLLFRFEPEYGNQKRVEGHTFVFGGNISF